MEAKTARPAMVLHVAKLLARLPTGGGHAVASKRWVESWRGAALDWPGVAGACEVWRAQVVRAVTSYWKMGTRPKAG